MPASTSVVVVGEAVVDMARDPETPPGQVRLIANPGGSPANVAVGLARLEVPTAFAGRLSVHGLGPWLRDHLAGNGVDLNLAVAAPENCSLALVTLDRDGVASYTFYVDGTADWQWQAGELPDPRALDAQAVHTGSLAAVLPPGNEELARWLKRLRAAGRVMISIDPNIRPALIPDLHRYRATVDALVAVAHLVKVSEDDLKVLYPGQEWSRAARGWCQAGPELVVVTHGAGGSTAVRPGGHTRTLRCPAPVVSVVDTVGAGDAFMAGFLAHLARTGQLQPGRLLGLTEAQLRAALDVANRVAATTCTRLGADPPKWAEVMQTRSPGSTPSASKEAAARWTSAPNSE